jgi:putative transposase
MGSGVFRRGVVVRIQDVKHRFFRRVSTIWHLEKESGEIVRYEHDTLLQFLADGKLVFVPNGGVATGHPCPPYSDLSDQELEIAKERRMYVLVVLNLPRTESSMTPAIQEVWQKYNFASHAPSWSTVYRWAKRNEEADGDFRVLVDNSRHKGNRDPRYPKEVIDICEQVIDAVYLSDQRRTMRDTCDAAIVRVRQENRERPASTPLKVPTYGFVRRLIGKIDAFEKDAARLGRDAAVRKYRIVNGHVAAETPLQRAEIDHTVLDLCVVDDRTCLPLGRPTITACIDSSTRCILGIYVGFAQPSCLSVSRCLKHAFYPKLNLRQQYPDIQNEWLAYGIMDELVIDNGREFHSKALENGCFSLAINMRYSPRRQPWCKPFIERWLGTLNKNFAQTLPGTSFSNTLERGDYNSAAHAGVRMSTLVGSLMRWICDVYHQRTHRGLKMSPSQKWLTSINVDEIRLPANASELDFVIGRPESRRLTHRGIQFEELLYSSQDLVKLRSRLGANLNVEIRVDDGDLGHIFVIDPESGEALRVPAINFEYANGLTRWQHSVFCKRAKKLQLSNDTDGWLEAKENITRRIEEDFKIVRKTSRKKIARFLEDNEQHDADKHSGRALLQDAEAAKSLLGTPPAEARPGDSGLKENDDAVPELHFRTTLQRRARYD